MEKSRLEMKVGLFVFVGLALVAALLVQFSKGTSLFGSTYLLKMHAENVGGLKQNAGVLLAGVGVGSVQKIQLEPSGTNVTITLQIYKNYPIYHDAQFVIEASGFLGDQYVSVIPTANTMPLLTNGQDVICEAPFNLQEVARGAAGFVSRLDETAKKLDSSITDLRAQLLNAKTLGNFGSSVTNLRVFTEQAVGTISNINDLINTNSAQISAAVSNIYLFSTELAGLGNSASNILATNGVNLTAATKGIKDLVDNVQAGQGLAGALVENSQVSTNVQVLAENLAIASSNLNRYGLWHFLWSHPPAVTNSVKPKSGSKSQ
ncbi:MAG TPA: MlaD family protein [Verrucomicrobiae bacterium]|nr:MlaD family protein [Verrucomicrobiae bacterium]